MDTTPEFPHVLAGLLRTGTVTSRGVIDAVSLTAYKIGGEWVPFQVLHGRPAPVMPLVVFA